MRRYIQLKCRECGSLSCERRPLGSWNKEDRGCQKEVTELEFNKFLHYTAEARPRMLYQELFNVELWQEYVDFMEYIENKPFE